MIATNAAIEHYKLTFPSAWVEAVGFGGGQAAILHNSSYNYTR